MRSLLESYADSVVKDDRKRLRVALGKSWEIGELVKVLHDGRRVYACYHPSKGARLFAVGRAVEQYIVGHEGSDEEFLEYVEALKSGNYEVVE